MRRPSRAGPVFDGGLVMPISTLNGHPVVNSAGQPIECDVCPCEPFVANDCGCCTDLIGEHPTLSVAVSLTGGTAVVLVSTSYTGGSNPGCCYGGWFGSPPPGTDLMGAPVTSGTFGSPDDDVSFLLTLFTDATPPDCSWVGSESDSRIDFQPSGVGHFFSTIDHDDCTTFPKTLGTLVTAVVSIPMMAMARFSRCPNCGAEMSLRVPCPPPKKCSRKVCPNCEAP